MDDHVEIDLKMIPTIIDPSLSWKFEDDQLIGINGTYVDDSLQAVANKWKIQASETLKRFETTGNKQPLFKFITNTSQKLKICYSLTKTSTWERSNKSQMILSLASAHQCDWGLHSLQIQDYPWYSKYFKLHK